MFFYMESEYIYLSYSAKKSFVQKKLHPKMFIPKFATLLLNMFKLGPRIFMRSTMQLFKANLFVRILTSLLVLLYDLAFLLTKRISKKQFAINTVVTLSLLVGGTAGWYGGQYAVLGVIVENTVLWFAVCFVSSGVMAFLMEKMARKFVLQRYTSDAEDVSVIFNKVFLDLKNEYSIGYETAQKIASNISLSEKICLTCFCNSNKEKFADDFLRPYFQMMCPLKGHENNH